MYVLGSALFFIGLSLFSGFLELTMSSGADHGPTLNKTSSEGANFRRLLGGISFVLSLTFIRIGMQASKKEKKQEEIIRFHCSVTRSCGFSIQPLLH